MRKDKSKIFEMRKIGMSYREIQKETGVTRSTLCNWFKKENWSNQIKDQKIASQLQNQTENLSKMRLVRRRNLDNYYKKLESEAVKEYGDFRLELLFIAGLMLYAGEGDKVSAHISRLSNIDFGIHRIFINFILSFLDSDINNVRVGLLLYPDHDMDECRNKWSKELNIPIDQFHKVMVIKGKHKTKRLHFGVGSTILIGTAKKKKLLIWLDLAKKELSNAAMV